MAGHAHDELHTFSADRFAEGDFIGGGRNAEVYSAHDLELGRVVALKIAREDTIVDALGKEQLGELGLDTAVRELVGQYDRGVSAEYTLLREARIAATVEHPGVVPILEVGRFAEDGRVAVVMPFLNGKPLAPTYPWRTILERVRQLAGGLAALHEVGVVHRDLKSDNVLYDHDGWPCIADLGLACRLDDEVAMSHLAGTSRWMAPEVLDQGGGGVQNDLFAFCMVAFECFYGHPPFADENAKKAGRVSEIHRDDDMPAELRAVLLRGLAPDPAKRWASMAEVIVALDEAALPPKQQPKQQPKRWLLAAGFAVAAAVGGGMCVAMPEARADACDEVASELVDFWNPDVQAELRVVLGTRRAGDRLESFASRWVAVRAKECEAAKRDDRAQAASPCTASVRDNLNATVATLRAPDKREGVAFEQVLAELPEPEYCLDHPEDAEHGNGGLLELRRLDLELGLLLASGELEVAERRQADYMLAARAISAQYDIARAIHWRAELHRLRGELDEAEDDFERAYAEAVGLGAREFEGEAMMKLAAVAGARGDLAAVDHWAFVARTVFAQRRPGKVAELLQVQGLALVEGGEAQRARGLALLHEAVDLREAQYSRYGGSREQVGRAMESLARGLLAVKRADEALPLAERSLAIHELEYGGLTERAHELRRVVFVAQVGSEHLDDAYGTVKLLLGRHGDAQDWSQFVNEALWLGNIYSRWGLTSQAVNVLVYARQVTLANNQGDLTHKVNQRLDELAMEKPD